MNRDVDNRDLRDGRQPQPSDLTQEEELLLCGVQPGSASAAWLLDISSQLAYREEMHYTTHTMKPLHIAPFLLSPVAPSGRRRRASMDAVVTASMEAEEEEEGSMWSHRRVPGREEDRPSDDRQRSQSAPGSGRNASYQRPAATTASASPNMPSDTMIYRGDRLPPLSQHSLPRPHSASMNPYEPSVVQDRLRTLKRGMKRNSSLAAPPGIVASRQTTNVRLPPINGIPPPPASSGGGSSVRRRRLSSQQAKLSKFQRQYWIEKTRVVVMSLGDMPAHNPRG